MCSLKYPNCICDITITFVIIIKTMKIKENFSLQPFNTFGISANARYFVNISSADNLKEIIADKTLNSLNIMMLGGGSNILLRNDFPGLVLKVDFKGIELLKEDAENYYVKVGAGENWHDFVMFCVNKGYGGVENLSLIPGNVGAAPIQNIGAYGVEFKDVFHELDALHLMSGERRVFSKEDCAFGYRDSVFKNKHKGLYVISSVTLKLKKKADFNISYAGLQTELNKIGAAEPSIKLISDAVCNIRRSKLPDPSEIGNAGSFFKNPVITQSEFRKLREEFSEIVSFKSDDGNVKLAAAWLIDQCNWKGKRFGDAGVHKDHALVLSNYGNASGNEIYNLSLKIMESVKSRYGINLEREVNVI